MNEHDDIKDPAPKAEPSSHEAPEPEKAEPEKAEPEKAEPEKAEKPAGPPKRTVEAWREAKQTDRHLYAGACASWQWVKGVEMTEADYDAAVKSAGEVVSR